MIEVDQWKGQKAFIIASGPSLKQSDCDLLKGQNIIAVNLSVLMAPFASCMYAGDHKFYSAYVDVWKAFKGPKYSINTTVSKEFPEVIQVKTHPKKPLGKDYLGNGGNSAYQAANLAYIFGATSIYLLGVDCKPSGTRNHWHEDHKRNSGYNLTNPNHILYSKWIPNFSRLSAEMQKEGVQLINCSRDSALTITKMELEQCLN